MSKEEIKEAVDETIKELHAEKNRVKVERGRPLALTIIMYIFFPLTLLALLVLKLTKKIKIPITVKMMVIFSLVFLIMLLGFVFFLLATVNTHLAEIENSAKFLKELRTTSIILIIIFLIVFTALVAVSSSLMLNPIRIMSDKIDSITSEDLSQRLENIDSQDELMVLTDRINGMLENLEESFVRQQNFVSDASHELKTPISVIQGYSSLLKRWGTQDPAILNESIESIHRESENMKRIVEQLLLLAKLGKMNMTKSAFNVCEMLYDMVDAYRIVDTTHKISFWTDEEITIDTDRNLFLEAVRTLVDNAIKYTPAGGEIKITCQTEGEKVRIRVADTGIGIAESEIDKVFDRFYRCDKARGRETGSSGLGLTIAKSIINMMGGDITLESVLGKGSTFIIELY